jgi:hypothetical protein
MTTPKTEADWDDMDPLPPVKTGQSRALMANESWEGVGFGHRHKADRRDMHEALLRVEEEAGRLAVAEALSVERIAENLTSLFQQAFPTTDRDEMAYLIDSWIWAEGAAALRAALSPEQPEVTE